MKAPFDCAAEEYAGQRGVRSARLRKHVASKAMNTWCFGAGRMLILKIFRGLFHIFKPFGQGL